MIAHAVLQRSKKQLNSNNEIVNSFASFFDPSTLLTDYGCIHVYMAERCGPFYQSTKINSDSFHQILKFLFE